ncbi:nitrous oxide reductase accessory protein NosL [Calidifontibacillus oryziterrae]|uniref:nitrous oxide reductase accessory protein NosL n=1 Tax=Calidifontibacillus oryziterrae TaxID=1191699 RepID=UPI0002EA4A7D|nr:nitrous oxide reductase accessory protein NosL [Calidifontibacillus oryziterrae]
MQKLPIYHIFIMLAVIILLSACGEEGEIMPQAIDEEIDVCEVCYMMVPDNQFGAQIVTGDGKVYKFDDIGCMAMYINDYNPDGAVFSRDFYTNEWIEIDKSMFVATTDVETPMNYGYVSFGSRENLEKFLTESNGEEVNWADILENQKERSNHDEN